MKGSSTFCVLAALVLPFSMAADCDGGKPCEPTGAPIEPTYRLVFQSGFEPDTQIVDRTAVDAEIIGNDQSSGGLGDWQGDVESGMPFGSVKLFFQDGDTDARDARLVSDPEDATNQVMEYWLQSPHIPNQPDPKGRIQLGIRNNRDLRALRYQVRMRLEEGFTELLDYPDRITWLTLAEFWNNTTGTSFPFRVTLNLNKPDSGPGALVWNAHGQNKLGGRWNTLWQQRNLSAPVPLEQWFTLDVELREGCRADGLFRVLMTTEDGTQHTLIDQRGDTQHPDDPAPDGLSNLNPMKLYTSGPLIRHVENQDKALRILWDDFSLYAGE